MCPAMAEGQHLNARLAAAGRPLGRGVHGLEEVKEIILGQAIQLIFIVRLTSKGKRKVFNVFIHKHYPFCIFWRGLQNFLPLSFSIYIIT